jgi:para-nitrobenzyl esterase
MEFVTKLGYKGYACIFDQVPSRWRKEGGVSIHSIELLYVFGDWDNSTKWWSSLDMFAQQVGAKTADPGLDATDRSVSEAMMGLWTGFARTGKPQAEGIPEWPAYSALDDRYMYVNQTLEVKTGYSKFGK